MSDDKRREIVKELQVAYWMEIETVMSYIANSTNLDGVRAEEIKKALAADVVEELGHAQTLARRIKTIGGRVPGSMEFKAQQQSLQPTADSTDVVSVIKGVIAAEDGAIAQYNKLIKLCDGVDFVTQDLCITSLADEEEHRRAFVGYLTEYEKNPGLTAAVGAGRAGKPRMSDLIEQLPRHLRERARALNADPVDRAGEFVLLWMHHAVRGHENPALDVAVHAGNALGIPVVVYQGLGGAHRFNSDRHHTFIMEGARDAQRELRRRGIAYGFHPAINSVEPSPLRRLVSRAAVVVCEDFPAPPFPAWSQRLASRARQAVWAVDCACVVPMQSLPRRFERAFQFKKATAAEYAARVPVTWRDAQPQVPVFAGDLGFDGLDLATCDIAEVCAACDIDHTIGPVWHTPGGADAGYRRWEAFQRHALSSYARLRNDACVEPPRGVSRMSAYLHHGHVSPMRIAREAYACTSAGAEKFLDELLNWRELAYNFCFHTQNVEDLSALPAWARATLAEHASDERPAVYSWSDLARARTADELWNAAQRSLLIHGELHNNVRMTWGKAVLQWTTDPAAALRLLIDLNHRYALDGNDPCSYGGLLWCLGLFDRPFPPGQAVLGTVRPRSTRQHATRLDLERYEHRTARPARGDVLRIGVIGAGVAGLAAARALADQGHDVHVFEKSRGTGGRMATRRVEPYCFDHGAQYFTAGDPRFVREVESWMRSGVVATWDGRFVHLEGGRAAPLAPGPRFVGVPGMSAMARAMSTGLRVTTTAPIRRILNDGGWVFENGDGVAEGPFHAAVVTAPAPQALALLDAVPELADRVAARGLLPCWAVMAAFDRRLDIPFDGATVGDSSLAWIARNNSKPGRPSPESWVLHATPEWSVAHLEETPDRIEDVLLGELFRVTGIATVKPGVVQVHRWRYARPDDQVEPIPCLWDAQVGIAACGDWCSGGRVEHAFLSGCAAAGHILQMKPVD